MLNSIGLPNKGLEGYLAHDLPELAQLPVPLIVNVMGFTREQVATLVEAFGDRDEVAGLELNVSCPNVETGMIMGADPHETGALLDAVRPHTRKPLIVKLTPNCTSPGDVAAAAEAHGADAVSLVNTLRGMAFHPRRPSEPWLGGGTGGMSGPAVRAIALAQVAEVRSAGLDPDRRDGRGPERTSRVRLHTRGRRCGGGRNRVVPRSAGGRPGGGGAGGNPSKQRDLGYHGRVGSRAHST